MCSSPSLGAPHSPLCFPSAIKGWFSPYHRKHQFGNPRNMESFGSKVLKYVILGAPWGCVRGSALGSLTGGSWSPLFSPTRLHEDWESFIRDLRTHLEGVYYPDTVEEWMEENVNPYLDQLRDLVRDYQAIIRLNARPKAT